MTDQLRASDAERQDVGALLSRHFVDGRLDRDELEERLGAAMQARTRGELAGLLLDLPALEGAPPAVPLQRPSRRAAALALALPLLAVPLLLLGRVHAHVAPSVARAIPAHLLPVHVPIGPRGPIWVVPRDGLHGRSSDASSLQAPGAPASPGSAPSPPSAPLAP